MKRTTLILSSLAVVSVLSVGGVKSVSVDFEAKTATVIFDSAATSTEQIGAASTNAGYPATPI